MHDRHCLLRLFICCAMLAGSLHAEIATAPLTSQSWVPPNVVVSLDDSGSMFDECIPGRLCIGGLNAGSVYRPMLHPSIASIPYQPSSATTTHPLFEGLLTYNSPTLEIIKQRTSTFNKTYYDPTIRYKPWTGPTGALVSETNPQFAHFNGNNTVESLDLSSSLTYTGNFCTTMVSTSCSNQTETFKPAQYYVLNAGANGDAISDFTRIVIVDRSSFTKGPDRLDCAGANCTQAEEMRNFINWFAFARTEAAFAGDPFSIYPTTYDATNLYARQMRSPQINSSYYNPERRYLPWMKADLSSYPNSTPTAARYDPNEPAYTLNLTRRLVVGEIFCKGPYRTQCEPSTQNVYPAQYFIKTDGTDGTATSHFTQVNINTGSNFAKVVARTDCLGSSCTQAEELQNFANWFTYYRNKWLSAKAAISQTFMVIPGETRLGYGVISQPNNSTNIIDGVQTGILQRGVRPFNGAGRSDFYNWLLNLKPLSNGAGTPLRRTMVEVGNYYMRSDAAGPWAETPGGISTALHIQCRRALHLLITDGSWSGGAGNGTELTNVTGAPGATLANVNVDGSSARPFSDITAGTLADVAMYYWKTNLRPDLAGTVVAPQSEKDLGRNATWPHMVNYLIGFGVKGTLANPGDADALISGAKSWPVPVDESTKVDDMWHAAWNSGGLSFNASDPDTLSGYLGKVIDSMKEQAGSDAPLVLPSRFASSDYVYIPSYKSKSWSGDLSAYRFDRATGDRLLGTDGAYADAAWSAASRLNAMSHQARNIFSFDGTTGFAFDYASLNSKGLISKLTSNSDKAQDLINYLRGSSELEGTAGYRTRPNGKLGDIVNSPPLLVLDGEDASYDFLAPPSSGTRGNYRQFLLDKKKRRGQVFVGANDGMLHAFDANSGEETFAFIPQTVLGDLANLSAPGYAHRYYVDGPLTEGDVYDARVTPSITDTGWRNIVVGTGGAGARNVFAIRVPVLSNGDANTSYPPSASSILWEVNNDTSAEFSKLGFVLQKPAIGMLRDGTWAVVVGNGYVNGEGSAELFLINALTGAFIKSLRVPTTGKNGLGGVRLVLDLKRQITAAYAGDLQGNLWKFDFSSTSSSDWGVAFGDKPLFKAQTAVNGGTGVAQSITAAPAYLAHPQGGNLIVFGTGKLFELTDTNDNSVQSLYAIWDRVITGQPSGVQAAVDTTDTANGATIVSSTSLVEQTVTAIANTSYYSASKNMVNYPGKRGWYVKLNMSPTGLRSIFAPQLTVGKVFLQTLSPSSSADDACAQRSSKTVNFVLNPFTGSASSPTFDVNADGRIDAADGVDSSRNAINAVAVVSDGASYATFSQKVGASINSGVLTNATSQRAVTGATNALRRTWRQIINRPRPAAASTSAAGS